MRGKASWRLTLVLLGLAAYPLSPLLAAWPSLEMDLARYGGAPNLAIALTFLFALAARRAAWRATAATATLSLLVSLYLLPHAMQAISTPVGDTLLPRPMAWRFSQAEASRRAGRQEELAYLERGRDAALSGHPFRAPEGGYLVPQETANLREYDSPWRLASSPQPDTAKAWAVAVERQRQAVEESGRMAAIQPTNRPNAWFGVAVHLAVSTALLALAANLLGLASRRLLGAPK